MQCAIKYFSLWDVPRVFAFGSDDRVYLLMSEFDEDLDDYAKDYEVFVVSGIKDLSAVSDWKSIEVLPKSLVGTVPVTSVRFDESYRQYVDDSCLNGLQHSGSEM